MIICSAIEPVTVKKNPDWGHSGQCRTAAMVFIANGAPLRTYNNYLKVVQTTIQMATQSSTFNVHAMEYKYRYTATYSPDGAMHKVSGF
jgi:hypothetical protein